MAMKTEFFLKEKPYYSYLDEKYFYEWLEGLDGVRSVTSSNDGLCIKLAEEGMSRAGAYDLIALLTRYQYPMRFVSELIRPEDESWFREPEKYWHASVFGCS
jgi:hypothetical protein